MAKKIESVALTTCSLGAITNFYVNINSAIMATGAEELHVETLAPQFATAVENLQLVQNKQRSLDSQAEVLTADEKRDGLTSFLFGYIRQMVDSPVASEAEAAHRLKLVVDSYPNLRKLEMTKQTTQTNGLITDLMAKNEDLEAIRANAYVDALNLANAEVTVATGTRTTEAYTRATTADGVSSADLRREAANLYKQIVEVVNVMYSVSPTDAMSGFIDQANAEVLALKSVIATEQAAATRAANKEEGDGSSDGSSNSDSSSSDTSNEYPIE